MSDTLFDLPAAALAQIHAAIIGPPALDVIVRGLPAPQGSKKGFVVNGRAVVVDDNKKPLKDWRGDVKTAVEQARPSYIDPLDQPVVVQVVFTLAKPASAPKTRRIWPDKRPDLDKLVRAVCDALKAANVYTDDSRMVDLVAGKRYPNEGTDALPAPGAVIRVWPIGVEQ